MERTTELSNRQLGLWNIWEKKQAENAGETYGYDQELDMSPENTTVIQDWKYALHVYFCIIALAAIGVMTYVRSISVATDNKGLFENLTKLGADAAYKRRVLKKQIARIVQYPGIIGCVLGFVFAFVMNFMNDGRISGLETKSLSIFAVMLLGIGVVLYAVYKYAMNKAEKIVM